MSETRRANVSRSDPLVKPIKKNNGGILRSQRAAGIFCFSQDRGSIELCELLLHAGAHGRKRHPKFLCGTPAHGRAVDDKGMGGILGVNAALETRADGNRYSARHSAPPGRQILQHTFAGDHTPLRREVTRKRIGTRGWRRLSPRRTGMADEADRLSPAG